jgi:DNA-directed RNA polymerase specialized sigma24 family protein
MDEGVKFVDTRAILIMPDPDHSAPVALEDILRRVEPKLKRLLASYRIPVADAEDLVQESLCHLIYQLDKVRDPECWLLGTVASPQERRDLLADLDSLIAKLPPRCRSLLRLRFRLGYEPPEVAEKLGYQVSSIGKVTTRCLAALNRELLAAGFTGRTGNLPVLTPASPASSRPVARP